MKQEMDIRKSYASIRLIIGFLGLIMPFLVWLSNGELLASISHYYYAKSSLFFTSILSAFGLLLISYHGYEARPGEKISDNKVTNIAGVMALAVVLIPTSCLGSGSEMVDVACADRSYLLFGHQSTFFNTVHLVAAGIFLFSMGWMSINKFTLGGSKLNIYYRIAGYIVWGALAVLVLRFLTGFVVTAQDVFWLETIAVVAFGISWILKSKLIINPKE